MAEMKFSTLGAEKLAKLKSFENESGDAAHYKRFMFICTTVLLTRYNRVTS